MCSDLKNLKKMFYFFCITQESDPVQMYRSGINGLLPLLKKNGFLFIAHLEEEGLIVYCPFGRRRGIYLLPFAMY